MSTIRLDHVTASGRPHSVSIDPSEYACGSFVRQVGELVCESVSDGSVSFPVASEIFATLRMLTRYLDLDHRFATFGLSEPIRCTQPGDLTLESLTVADISGIRTFIEEQAVSVRSRGRRARPFLLLIANHPSVGEEVQELAQQPLTLPLGTASDQSSIGRDDRFVFMSAARRLVLSAMLTADDDDINSLTRPVVNAIFLLLCAESGQSMDALRTIRISGIHALERKPGSNMQEDDYVEVPLDTNWRQPVGPSRYRVRIFKARSDEWIEFNVDSPSGRLAVTAMLALTRTHREACPADADYFWIWHPRRGASGPKRVRWTTGWTLNEWRHHKEVEPHLRAAIASREQRIGGWSLGGSHRFSDFRRWMAVEETATKGLSAVNRKPGAQTLSVLIRHYLDAGDRTRSRAGFAQFLRDTGDVVSGVRTGPVVADQQGIQLLGQLSSDTDTNDAVAGLSADKDTESPFSVCLVASESGHPSYDEGKSGCSVSTTGDCVTCPNAVIERRHLPILRAQAQAIGNGLDRGAETDRWQAIRDAIVDDVFPLFDDSTIFAVQLTTATAVQT